MEAIWSTGITWNIFFQSLGIGLKMPMEGFSFLGTETFFLLLLPALYWCIDAPIGIRVAIILLLSNAVNHALKLTLHGPRPYWYSPEVIRYAGETSFGVPSGHAQIAFGVWGMLAYGSRKGWGWLSAMAIILLIGVSRLYLGVHFPHDVILGWMIGALMLWLVLHFWDPVTYALNPLNLTQKILSSFAGSLVLILFSVIPFVWLKLTNWQAPGAWAEYAKQALSLSAAFTASGTLFGFLTGLAWIHHRGGFDPKGPGWKRSVRYLLGLAGALFFYIGLKALLGWIVPDTEAIASYLLRYIRYFLVGAWVSAGAPWCFIKLRLAGKRPEASRG